MSKMMDKRFRIMEKKFFIENINVYQGKFENVKVYFWINTSDFPLMHSHEDYWEFTVVQSGTIENHVNGTTQICTPGTLFYCTTKDVHNLISNEKSIRYVNFTIAESAMEQLLAPFSAKTIDSLHRNQRIYSLPTEMFSSMETVLHNLNIIPLDQYEKTNDIIISQIMDFLQFIVLGLQSEESSNQPLWMQTLNEMKLSEEFFTYTVDDLCQKLNYSRMQLSRLFKAHFGTTPHDYLLSNRLLYAQNLLINTDLNTIEIANAVGYSNLAQFNIVFKNKFGVTPGQYRK